MAKALKIAALVVGVAAIGVITGGAGLGLGFSLATTLTIGTAYVSAGALLLAAGALSVGAALLTKTPSIPASQTQRLNASIDPRAFRKTVLGSTAMATDVRYEEWSGTDQDYCDWIICLASHAIDGLDQIWLNDELAWSAGVVQGKYAGYFSVPNIVLEGSPANAFTFASGKWNAATAHLTGCAYLRMRFKVTGNGKKAESPFSGGPASRMTIIGRGARLYDPRRDSTMGGNGPMRATDQSTWRYTTDDGAVIGENLPLQILRVLLGWRITNPTTGTKKLAVGAGIPPKRIDLASFIVAAGQAEELVNRSTGAPEPRYYGAGVISEGDDPKTTLDALCAACCSRFLDTGGRLSLMIAHNDLAEAATDEGLLTDDVVGAFTWDPDSAPDQTPNIIRGRYVDPSTESLYQLIDYPEVRLDSPDGIDRILTLDLGVVESASQAQRIAKQVLQRKQYQRTFQSTFDIRAWSWPVGKVVPFTFAPLGFDRKLFRVAEQEVGQGGACNMLLREESPTIYAWDADDTAPVRASPGILYDPTKAPIVQAIGEVESSALQVAVLNSWIVEVSAGIGVVAASADGTVTIDHSTRRYPDGHADVEVDGTTLASGLVPGDMRSLAYDDASRTGGAVTYSLYADDNDAHAGPAAPGRHYMGYVTIPATGTSTGGGGGVGGGRDNCVVATTMILMANEDRTGPGIEKPAIELRAGDWVWTQREVTFEWGAYEVEDVAVAEADVMLADGYPRATSDHRFHGDRWCAMSALGIPDGRDVVARITIKIARTIVTDGVLSHNIKQSQPEQ